MKISCHTVETTATPTQIWRVWEDVKTWKDWDHEIEFSDIDGPFEKGTCGHLKMLDSPVLKTKITQCDPFRSYIFEVKLLLAKAVSTSSINRINEKTYVTFKNEIRGPFAFFYVVLIGKKIRKKTPKEMQEMLKKANGLS